LVTFISPNRLQSGVGTQGGPNPVSSNPANHLLFQ
jgi:hypothetical protein